MYLFWAASSSSTSSFWHLNASASLSASHTFTYVKGSTYFTMTVAKNYFNRISFDVCICIHALTLVPQAHRFSSKSKHMTCYVLDSCLNFWKENMHWNCKGFPAALDAEILFHNDFPFLLFSLLCVIVENGICEHVYICKLSIRIELWIVECTSEPIYRSFSWQLF